MMPLEIGSEVSWVDSLPLCQRVHCPSFVHMDIDTYYTDDSFVFVSLCVFCSLIVHAGFANRVLVEGALVFFLIVHVVRIEPSLGRSHF